MPRRLLLPVLLFDPYAVPRGNVFARHQRYQDRRLQDLHRGCVLPEQRHHSADALRGRILPRVQWCGQLQQLRTLSFGSVLRCGWIEEVHSVSCGHVLQLNRDDQPHPLSQRNLLVCRGRYLLYHMSALSSRQLLPQRRHCESYTLFARLLSVEQWIVVVRMSAMSSKRVLSCVGSSGVSDL